jgi:hypothetical protein
MKSTMKYHSVLAMSLAAMVMTTLPLQAKDPGETAVVAVKMTVTASVDSGKRMPEIQKEDIVVKSGKDRLPVTDWVAARGDHAGLELFILIDDTATSSLGSQLDDLRTFVNAQPPATSVGVGYARNGTVQISQDLTTDHARAAKALRLPLGSSGAFGSPYLSVVSLMERWPASTNRQEVILVSDGIDRARRGRNALLNPDVDTAGDAAQRAGVIIHSIYFPGVGHWYRNFWEKSSGQNGLAKLSDMTGGESFFLGTQTPVTIAPYLEDVQKILDNQYLLGFSAQTSKKPGLKYISVSTELAGVDFAAADAVWVPAAK